MRSSYRVISSDLSTVEADCTDGEIRLVGGRNIIEGRVEICINRAWGTICDTAFSSEDATVICTQLGEHPEGKYLNSNLIIWHTQLYIILFTTFYIAATEPAEAQRGAFYGEGTGPIFLDKLGCMGAEASLLSCERFSALGLHSCDHSHDASVQCPGRHIIG